MGGKMFGPFLYGDILFGTPRHAPTYRTAEFKYRLFFSNRSPGYIGMQTCFTESVSTRKTFWFFDWLQTYWTIKRYIFTNSFPFHRHLGCFWSEHISLWYFRFSIPFERDWRIKTIKRRRLILEFSNLD